MRANKTWTDAEIQYLEENWGIKSVKCLSKNLSRSELAVTVKAQKLGLGSFVHAGELISIAQLLRALGLFNSYSWIKKKFISNGLPVVKKTVINKKVMKVSIDEFWKWAEQNKQLLNFARFEEGNLGVEPEWVKEKRKADLSNPSKNNHNRVWSKADDSLLISKVKSCRYTYKDLALEFGRTEFAIKRRLLDLKVPYRPIPLDNHKKWTEDENNLMIELYKKGYDCYAIAQKLNKTHLSIPDRLKARGYC